MSAAPAYSLHAIMLAGQSREKSDKLWMQGGREWTRGTICPLVTDSSMQTTSPQGRNQEAGPLTQAEEKEVEVHSSVDYGPYEKDLGRRSMSAGQVGQIDRLGLLKMSL